MNPRHVTIELAALAGLSAAFLALAPHDMRLFVPLALGFAAYVAWMRARAASGRRRAGPRACA